jgi:hypothetical protein
MFRFQAQTDIPLKMPPHPKLFSTPFQFALDEMQRKQQHPNFSFIMTPS